MLQEQTEKPGGDGADDQQPPQLCVGVVGGDLAIAQASTHPAEDPHPVAPEEEEEDDCRREMGCDEEGEEVLVVLVDVPPEEARKDDAVAQAGDREKLRHSLQQPEDDRLKVRNLRGEDYHSACSVLSPPVWNHAKTRSAAPRRKAAIPCFTWWCPEPSA